MSKKKQRQSEPPIVWRCPVCRYAATSAYAAKKHREQALHNKDV